MIEYEPQASELFEAISSLEKLYYEYYASKEDLKVLQGMERLIEIRMKLYGYDGKNRVVRPSVPDDFRVIELSKLSEMALREILELTNEQKEESEEAESSDC